MFLPWVPRVALGVESLRKIAKPEDVARSMAFLASHRAAGHISGQCLSVDGGMEGRLIWGNESKHKTSQDTATQSVQFPRPIAKRNKVRVAISIDLDAVSGWLGTGRLHLHLKLQL